MSRGWNLLGRHLLLQAGFILMAAGTALALRAHLGLSPWDVFHQGLSRHTPLTIGEASIVVGLVVLLVSMVLGVRPGVGTVLNMLLLGFWIDRILSLPIPDLTHDPWPAQAGMLVAALVCTGVGSGAYIGARLGAGPRDGFMLVLCRRLGVSIVWVRGAMELTVCLSGFVLGGTVGAGTVCSALLLGPAMRQGLRVFGFDAKGGDLRATAPLGAEAA